MSKKITFKYEVNCSITDKKRNILITSREIRKYKTKKCIENKKWYKYTCNKCGWTEGWIEEGNLTKKQGCACCSNKVSVLGINTILDTHNDLVVHYGLNEEFAKSHTIGTEVKGLVICKDCMSKRYVLPTNILKYKSIGCICGDGKSYVSKYLYSVLLCLNSNLETEVKYEWNKYINPKTNKMSQASVDFVVYKGSREIPIEADGGWHRTDNTMSGQTKGMSQYIDKQRDENCLKYLGEKTIRISDEGNVKENILNSKLAIEFDLSKIDWLKCEEFALKNVVKEVCKYWEQEKENASIVKAINIFNISRSIVVEYLKKGTQFSWCNYNEKEELKKGRLKGLTKVNEIKKIPIEILKNDVSLGEFESIAELSRKSEAIFGVKMFSPNISAVCLGKHKTYKGFTFKNLKIKDLSNGNSSFII